MACSECKKLGIPNADDHNKSTHARVMATRADQADYAQRVFEATKNAAPLSEAEKRAIDARLESPTGSSKAVKAVNDRLRKTVATPLAPGDGEETPWQAPEEEVKDENGEVDPEKLEKAQDAAAQDAAAETPTEPAKNPGASKTQRGVTLFANEEARDHADAWRKVLNLGLVSVGANKRRYPLERLRSMLDAHEQAQLRQKAVDAHEARLAQETETGRARVRKRFGLLSEEERAAAEQERTRFADPDYSYSGGYPHPGRLSEEEVNHLQGTGAMDSLLTNLRRPDLDDPSVREAVYYFRQDRGDPQRTPGTGQTFLPLFGQATPAPRRHPPRPDADMTNIPSPAPASSYRTAPGDAYAHSSATRINRNKDIYETLWKPAIADVQKAQGRTAAPDKATVIGRLMGLMSAPGDDENKVAEHIQNAHELYDAWDGPFLGNSRAGNKSAHLQDLPEHRDLLDRILPVTAGNLAASAPTPEDGDRQVEEKIWRPVADKVLPPRGERSSATPEDRERYRQELVRGLGTRLREDHAQKLVDAWFDDEMSGRPLSMGDNTKHRDLLDSIGPDITRPANVNGATVPQQLREEGQRAREVREEDESYRTGAGENADLSAANQQHLYPDPIYPPGSLQEYQEHQRRAAANQRANRYFQFRAGRMGAENVPAPAVEKDQYGRAVYNGDQLSLFNADGSPHQDLTASPHGWQMSFAPQNVWEPETHETRVAALEGALSDHFGKPTTVADYEKMRTSVLSSADQEKFDALPTDTRDMAEAHANILRDAARAQEIHQALSDHFGTPTRIDDLSAADVDALPDALRDTVKPIHDRRAYAQGGHLMRDPSIKGDATSHLRDNMVPERDNAPRTIPDDVANELFGDTDTSYMAGATSGEEIFNRLQQRRPDFGPQGRRSRGASAQRKAVPYSDSKTMASRSRDMDPVNRIARQNKAQLIEMFNRSLFEKHPETGENLPIGTGGLTTDQALRLRHELMAATHAPVWTTKEEMAGMNSRQRDRAAQRNAAHLKITGATPEQAEMLSKVVKQSIGSLRAGRRPVELDPKTEYGKQELDNAAAAARQRLHEAHHDAHGVLARIMKEEKLPFASWDGADGVIGALGYDSSEIPSQEQIKARETGPTRTAARTRAQLVEDAQKQAELASAAKREDSRVARTAGIDRNLTSEQMAGLPAPQLDVSNVYHAHLVDAVAQLILSPNNIERSFYSKSGGAGKGPVPTSGQGGLMRSYANPEERVDAVLAFLHKTYGKAWLKRYAMGDIGPNARLTETPERTPDNEFLHEDAKILGAAEQSTENALEEGTAVDRSTIKPGQGGSRFATGAAHKVADNTDEVLKLTGYLPEHANPMALRSDFGHTNYPLGQTQPGEAPWNGRAPREEREQKVPQKTWTMRPALDAAVQLGRFNDDALTLDEKNQVHLRITGGIPHPDWVKEHGEDHPEYGKIKYIGDPIPQDPPSEEELDDDREWRQRMSQLAQDQQDAVHADARAHTEAWKQGAERVAATSAHYADAMAAVKNDVKGMMKRYARAGTPIDINTATNMRLQERHTRAVAIMGRSGNTTSLGEALKQVDFETARMHRARQEARETRLAVQASKLEGREGDAARAELNARENAMAAAHVDLFNNTVPKTSHPDRGAFHGLVRASEFANDDKTHARISTGDDGELAVDRDKVQHLRRIEADGSHPLRKDAELRLKALARAVGASRSGEGVPLYGPGTMTPLASAVGDSPTPPESVPERPSLPASERRESSPTPPESRVARHLRTINDSVTVNVRSGLNPTKQVHRVPTDQDRIERHEQLHALATAPDATDEDRQKAVGHLRLVASDTEENPASPEVRAHAGGVADRIESAGATGGSAAPRTNAGGTKTFTPKAR